MSEIAIYRQPSKLLGPNNVVPNGKHRENLALPDFGLIALSDSLLLRVECR
jgi:hypothetical protein